MNINKGKIAILAGALTMSLMAPAFAGQELPDYAIRTIAANPEAQLIHKEMPHWAEFQLYRLEESFQQAVLLMKGELDVEISYDNFQSLIRSTLDSGFSADITDMTREEAVAALMQLWADKTGQQLEEMMYPMMLVYEDTEKISIDKVHNVMLAYFNGIALGRGNNKFYPRAKLTFAEAVTLVNRVKDAIDAAEGKNNGGIVAGSYETRGDYEITENEVVFDFELFSHFTDTQQLCFGSGKQFEVVIYDENQEEVYRYSDGRVFTLALVYKTLEPGESIKWQDKWDKTNKDGEALTEGKFTAVINIDVIPEEEQELQQDQLQKIIEFSL